MAFRQESSPASGEDNASRRRFGPVIHANETSFRLWAPSAAAAELLLQGRDAIVMSRSGDGFWRADASDSGPGTRYKFRIGDLTFPDLASRQQDGDTSGWSIVREPLAPSKRSGPVRPWHETVICEVHVGAVTPEGTFNALRDRLGHFHDAGFTCLEIMPVNAFPGARNWGYDGTLLFAPASAYGTPKELCALVDAAHDLGLSMVLDVVYNHFGDTDNFVRDYAPEWFSENDETPWGAAINFNEQVVREFYYENAAMWLLEYDFDGLRFDSVHEIKTGGRDRFLGELASTATGAKPHARLIVENVQNSFHWLERTAKNQPMRYTSQWNDDMHHVLAYLVTGEGPRTGYDDQRKDPYADLEKALADGFVHDPTEGDGSDGRTRGGKSAKLPPDSFITYVQNHDQLGNRSDSTRLSERISPALLDFLHFVKFLAPQIPLCFMGDEANLTSGFPFFFDLPPDTAKAKADDRYDQMRDMFKDEVEPGGLPDPNDPATFVAAKLPWQDYEQLPERRAALERFQLLGEWRREKVWPLSKTPCLDARTARQGNCLIVTWVFEAGELSMAINPTAISVDVDCTIERPAVSSGHFTADGSTLHLAPWSAVAW